MKTILYSFLFALLFHAPASVGAADDSKELRKQRQEAQKQRQQQVRERTLELNDATRAFREYTRELEADYREQVKDLDIEFELQQVELNADHEARVAGAEADYQTKLTSLFMNPEGGFTDESLQQMQAEAKTNADALFELKKQSAEELHKARIANTESKNALLVERDRLALDEASSQGLTRQYSPVLATPIGEGLTRQEERWNEREKKAVQKLEERNQKTLSEFRNGEKLRQWELENQNEDFKLAWDEKARLHELDSEQGFYNALFMQGAKGGEVDGQELMAQMAELNEKKKLINIEYRKIREKNRITRREERKAILAN